MTPDEFSNVLKWARRSDSPLIQSIWQIYNQSDFEAYHPMLLGRDIAVELCAAVKMVYADEPNYQHGPLTHVRIPIAVTKTTVTAKVRRLSARWTFEISDVTRDDEMIDEIVEDIVWEQWAKENWYGDYGN